MCSRRTALLLVLLLGAGASPAAAKVFHTKAEGLALAFPDADRVESQTLVLSDEQVKAVESRARSRLDSKLVTIHRGMKGEEVLGYAFLDVHTVRTLPEALLVVLTPEGSVRSLRVLAFHEPLEYKPRDRWYDQFQNKSLRDQLRLDRDIHGVVGATLSSRATTRGVRRALAFHEVLVREGR